MGLAPSRNGENPRKSVVAKVPVPIFSQPHRAERTYNLACFREFHNGSGTKGGETRRWPSL
jgi:hypothetical protein